MFTADWRCNVDAQADGRRDRPKERDPRWLPYVRPRSLPRARPGAAYGRLQAPAARAFRLLTVHPGPDMPTAAVAAVADLPIDEVPGVLANLAHEQLVEALARRTKRWRLADIARPYAERLADKLAEADGREQARDRLFDYYLITTEAADERLRGLPPVPVTHEFTDRKGALNWLDAERASLVAAVRAAADAGRTTPRRACRCCWPITWASGACSTTCCRQQDRTGRCPAVV